jgi:hypothetical protein
MVITPVGTRQCEDVGWDGWGTVASSTWSLVACVGSCTQTCCLCMTKCEMHVPGMTRAQTVCQLGLLFGCYVVGILCEYIFLMSSYLFICISFFVVQI